MYILDAVINWPDTWGVGDTPAETTYTWSYSNKVERDDMVNSLTLMLNPHDITWSYTTKDEVAI